jgi:hypothetical protein
MAKERGEPNRQVVWERDAVNVLQVASLSQESGQPIMEHEGFSGIFWG